MTGIDFDQWLNDMLAARPAARGMAALDSTLITDLAELLAVDAGELALTVRCLMDVHAVSSSAYEIRTGNWRIDLLPATAKAVLSAAVATTVMQHMALDSLPVAVLGAVAALLFSIDRVEISAGELVLHARLLDAVTGSPRDLDTLYQALPQDVRDELTTADLADVVERFHQAGLARWEEDGITLIAAGRQRKVRLVSREPGFALAASQARAAKSRPAAAPTDVSREVFVIHGRDEQARKTMFELLRALDLRPQEWEPLVAATGSTLPNLNEVVTTGLSAGQAQAVVAILTPDDIVTLHPTLREAGDPADETSMVMQPRPNVLIELGMAMSAYRNRTIIVQLGRLRRIADLDGLSVIRFDGSGTAIGKLVERLKLAGCAVDDTGSDWRETQRFLGLDSYTRQPSAEI
jgi:predicted nucleotide-binding protein